MMSKKETYVKPYERKNKKNPGKHTVSGHTRKTGSRRKVDKPNRGKSEEEIENELYDMGHFGRTLYSNITPKEWADAMESVGHTYDPMRKLVTYEWLSGEKVYKDVREHLSEDKRSDCDEDYWMLWGYLIGMSDEQVNRRMGIDGRGD